MTKYLELVILFIFLQYTCWSNESFHIYNKDNTPLQSNSCFDLLHSTDGDVWICTNKGIAVKKPDSWVVYDSSNSVLPNYLFWCVAEDSLNNFWFGTMEGVIFKYDQLKWYSWELGDRTFDIEVDKDNNIWIAGYDYLKKFNGDEWISFEFLELQEGHPGYIDLEFDHEGQLWLASGTNGIYKFINNEFVPIGNFSRVLKDIEFDKDNNLLATGHSGIYRKLNNDDVFNFLFELSMDYGDIWKIEPENDILWLGLAPTTVSFCKYDYNEVYFYSLDSLRAWITQISIDKRGNKWLSTSSQGVYVFNENGVELGVSEKYELFKISCFPNPFSQTSSIKFNLESNSKVILSMSNTLGVEIDVLIDEYMPQGEHEITFDGSNLPSGTYYYVFKAGSQIETGKLLLIK